jgi:ectoine hydroxylase-related dioxygenase (phytanoyl-CoA dioxygenase family)
VRLERVLSDDDVEELREALWTWIGRAPVAERHGILRHNVWAAVPAFGRHVRSGRLAAIARELLGVASITLFQDNLIWKPPGTTECVAWHQDYAYWPLGAPRGVTLWIPLDDADAESGCLRYIPGTHRLGERRATDFVAGTNQPQHGELPPLDAHQREGDAVSVPLPAGAALAHDPLVWHMSPGNRSARHRRAWSLSWIHAEVRWDPAHAPHPYNWRFDPRPGDAVQGESFPRFP